jgi:pyruvate,water dikinase
MKLLIKGLPASAGRANGRTRVILPTQKAKQRLQKGEILVARMTDASMFVGIIENTAAIVTDLGGLGSHPAIVARELGIPCVVLTKKATKVIKTGMKIIVDGNKGEVYEQN